MHEPTELTIDKDVAITVRDGTVLRADVFRPSTAAPHPVILTHGPYGKDIHFEDFNPTAFALVEERGPYLNWETVNPEWWVPQGYAVVRVDQRGTGRSAGRMDLFSPSEYEDFHDAVEWAGVQPWSNGKVGLLGISYYAIGQWHVAGMRPPHLAAIVAWEGASDLYREFFYHGGILSSGFLDAWWVRQITGNQAAVAPGADNPGAAVADNVELPAVVREHPLQDDFWAARTPDLAAIDVPVLSAGNWAGYALHLRGNLEGYLAAGTSRKWLEVHAGNHFAPFYTLRSRRYQRDFLDRWLKDDPTAWVDQPPVRLTIRTSTGTFEREEREWPLARTVWTPVYLDAASGALAATAEPPAASAVEYDAPDGSVTFLTAPLTEDLELTGPSALHLWVDSSVTDADLFVTVIDIGPDGRECTFEDASGLQGPVVKGWLRASHRALDPERSLPYRPVHRHDAPEPLTPGVPVEVVVEIAPTSLVVERGHRLGVVVAASDRDEPTRFRHDDTRDRAGSREGTVRVHTGGEMASHLLAPVIPAT